MSKCFLNSGKKLAKVHAVIFAKNVKPLNSDALYFRKNDVTEPKATLINSKVQF